MADDDVRIDLKVKALPNDTYDVRISPESTVLDLKKILEEKTQTPEGRQRLIYRGRVLQNQTTLAENALESGHTIHLVERNPDAPPQQPPPSEPTPQRGPARGAARISVNVLPEGGRELHDIGRIVQGVLSAVGVRSGDDAPPAPNLGPVPLPTGGRQGGETVEQVPHQLLALSNYLRLLEEGRVQTRMMQLIALAPQAQGGAAQNWSVLTGALCRILANAPLSPELQRQFQTAQEALSARPGQEGSGITVPFAASADGAVHLHRVSGVQPNASPSPPYLYLPLLIAGFNDLVRRTETLLREKAIRALSNAHRQLQDTTEIDETNQEIIIGSVRQVGSVANWYAALLTELARVANGVVSAVRGEVHPLAFNTASVITPDGAAPNFPPLFPQATSGARRLREVRMSSAVSSPRPAAPGQEDASSGHVSGQSNSQSQPQSEGGNETVTGGVSFSVTQSSEPGLGDLVHQVGPVVEQVTMAIMQNRDSIIDGIASAMGFVPTSEETQTTAPPPATAAIPVPPIPRVRTPPAATAEERPTEQRQESHPQYSAPASETRNQSTASGSRPGVPMGLSTGLAPRGHGQSTSTKRPATETTNQDKAEKTPKTAAPQPACQNDSSQQGMSGLLRSVASLVGQGREGGGLEGVVGNIASSLANNPNLRRLGESPAVQNLVSRASDPESGTPNLGRLMNEMAPLMSSLLGNSASPSRPAPPQDVALAVLSPERAAIWRSTLTEDSRQMNDTAAETPTLSAAYLAGRVTRGSSQSILPPDAEDLE